MSSANTPTLYPKITQHAAEVVKALKRLEGDSNHLEPIPIIGSVKLHGTHADVLVYTDGRIVLQSKNVHNITKVNDNYGFAAAMADRTAAILELRNQ